MSPRASRTSRSSRLTGLLGLVPIAVAATALAWADSQPADEPALPADPVTRLVGASALACPTFPFGDDSDSQGAATDVAVVAPDGGGRSPGGDVVMRTESETASATGSDGTTVAETDEAGPWQTGSLTREQAADLVVEASGGLGTGAAAFAAQQLPPGAGGGLAVQRCAAPARQWWFVGAGSSTERDSTLVLSNVDGTDAVVDVTLRTADGVAETVGTDGVRVRAGETVTMRVSGEVAGEDEVAIEVDATQGRVVAGVADDWSGGVDSLGSDWLPASPAPATSVLLPGVVDPGPRSALVVANPTDTTTPVRLSVVDESGTFVPTGRQSRLTLPAGSLTSVPLPDDIGDAAAVLVEADTPVQATARVASGSDIGYAVAAPDLDDAAVVPLDLGDSTEDVDVSVQLSALLEDGTDDAATRTATVTGYTEDGSETGRARVEVLAGTAQLVEPQDALRLTRPELADTAYLVVAPHGRSAAPLVGTTVMRGTDGQVAVLPLDPGLVRVQTPVLVPSVVPGR